MIILKKIPQFKRFFLTKGCWSRLISIFLLVAVVGGMYWQTKDFEFVWDDFTFIVEWEEIRDLSVNWKMLLRGSLPEGHEGVFRPVRSLWYGLAFAFFGVNASLYHLQAMVVHLVGVLLVYWFLDQVVGEKGAWFGAMLFGVLPIHAEAIAFVTTSFDVGGILLGLLGINLWVYSKSRKKSAWMVNSLRILSLVGFGLAFFIYEMTLTMPILLGLLLWYRYRYGVKDVIKQTLGVWLVWGFYWFVRMFVADVGSRGEWILGVWWRNWLFIPYSVYLYLRMTVWPTDSNVVHKLMGGVSNIYSFDVTSIDVLRFVRFQNVYFWGLLVGLSGIFWALWQKGYQQKILRVGLLWFLISLLPVLNFIPQDILWAEKYLYLASVGWVLVLAYCFDRLVDKKKWLLRWGLLIYLFWIAWLGFRRIGEWRDTQTLWRVTLDRAPYSALAANNLGTYYFLHKEYEEALELFVKAHQINPEDGLLNKNVGLALHNLNQKEKAEKFYQTALTGDPYNTEVLYYLAILKSQMGNFSEAAEYFEKILQVDSQNLQIVFELANVYQRSGNFEKAEWMYDKILETGIQNADVYHGFASLKSAQGFDVEAKQMYQKAIELDSNH